jgi:hypothetical protein
MCKPTASNDRRKCAIATLGAVLLGSVVLVAVMLGTSVARTPHRVGHDPTGGTTTTTTATPPVPPVGVLVLVDASRDGGRLQPTRDELHEWPDRSQDVSVPGMPTDNVSNAFAATT